MTTLKATRIDYRPESPPVILYERGMTDGSRDRRDGREHADLSFTGKDYADGYRRGWAVAGTDKESLTVGEHTRKE